MKKAEKYARPMGFAPKIRPGCAMFMVSIYQYIDAFYLKKKFLDMFFGCEENKVLVFTGAISSVLLRCLRLNE